MALWSSQTIIPASRRGAWGFAAEGPQTAVNSEVDGAARVLDRLAVDQTVTPSWDMGPECPGVWTWCFWLARDI